MSAGQDGIKGAVFHPLEHGQGGQGAIQGAGLEEEQEEGQEEGQEGPVNPQFLHDARELLPNASRRDLLAAWDRTKSHSRREDASYVAGSPRAQGKVDSPLRARAASLTRMRWDAMRCVIE